MKQIKSKHQEPIFNSSIEHLHDKTKYWISEIEFIKIEQDFLKELLAEHVMALCTSNNFKNAKLFLKGIYHEKIVGERLIESIKKHQINLALLIESIYLKKEDSFRKDHEHLKTELINYIDNFKYIKEQVFELILLIMKKEKKQKLLAK